MWSMQRANTGNCGDGDGMSVETSTAVARAWEEARRIGYDADKKKLISEGKYRERW